MNKRKKKKKSNHYFTQDTEDAIVAYARTEDIGVRTKLYVEHIQPAFNELVDKIVYTYKYTSLQNINPLKEDCKIWLTTILDKYNPDRGTKAFSYFSVVTKNWFTHKAKKQAKQNKQRPGHPKVNIFSYVLPEQYIWIVSILILLGWFRFRYF